MARYVVDQKIVDKSLNFWLGIDCYFTKYECEKIWKDEVDFYWDRYTIRSFKNPIRFYSSLDCINQSKLVSWYNNKISLGHMIENFELNISKYK